MAYGPRLGDVPEAIIIPSSSRSTLPGGRTPYAELALPAAAFNVVRHLQIRQAFLAVPGTKLYRGGPHGRRGRGCASSGSIVPPPMRSGRRSVVVAIALLGRNSYHWPLIVVFPTTRSALIPLGMAAFRAGFAFTQLRRGDGGATRRGMAAGRFLLPSSCSGIFVRGRCRSPRRGESGARARHRQRAHLRVALLPAAPLPASSTTRPAAHLGIAPEGPGRRLRAPRRLGRACPRRSGLDRDRLSSAGPTDGAHLGKTRAGPAHLAVAVGTRPCARQLPVAGSQRGAAGGATPWATVTRSQRRPLALRLRDASASPSGPAG